ncbi:hypothetical protein HHI36_021391 [Cryptolaemus montrouzieri]|uniref:Uncharacterized protein n=1 Tax=Cryptolaemus montrouzieri TaxID=559131 RepID=A0ABD2MWR8_9CUCU
MLSNGGSLQYEVFMKALGKDPLTKQIKGAILDSTPVRRTMLTSFLAIKADLRSGYLRIPTSVLLAVYCLLKGSLEKTYAKLSKTEYVQINPFENLKNEVNRWPQHFIYSTSDHIVSHRDVEEFAGHRRSLGIDVSLKCFENSDHVQHYPKNKLDYARSVIRFINKCLKKNGNEVVLMFPCENNVEILEGFGKLDLKGSNHNQSGTGFGLEPLVQPKKLIYLIIYTQNIQEKYMDIIFLLEQLQKIRMVPFICYKKQCFSLNYFDGFFGILSN